MCIAGVIEKLLSVLRIIVFSVPYKLFTGALQGQTAVERVINSDKNSLIDDDDEKRN